MMHGFLSRVAAFFLAVAVGACSGPRPAAPARAESPSARPRKPSARRAEAKPSYRTWLDVDPTEGVARMRATIESIPVGTSNVTLSFARQPAFVAVPPRFTEPLRARANGQGLAAPKRLDPYTFRVATGEAPTLELTWSIALDQRRRPEVLAGNNGYEHSFVEPGLGLLFMAELIPTPDIKLEEAFVELQGEDEVSLITHTGSASFELADRVLLLGDEWTKISTSAGGERTTFALSSDNLWLRPIVEERLLPIVQAESEIFGWRPQDPFLFVFGPSAGLPGYGGTSKAGAMTLFVSESLAPSVAASSISHRVAHEYLHLWTRDDVVMNDDLRFVDEGYTDYYAYIVPWRLGQISDATLHKTLESRMTAGADALASYGRSLVAAGGEDFFDERSAYNACYAAGLTLALWTDLAPVSYTHLTLPTKRIV